MTMAFTKTRIWRSGLADLRVAQGAGSVEEGAHPPLRFPVGPDAEAREAPPLPEPPPTKDEEVLAARPEHADAAPGLTHERSMAATRFYPIEQLISDRAVQQSTGAATTRRTLRDRLKQLLGTLSAGAPPRSAARLRWRGKVALAVLFGCVTVGTKLALPAGHPERAGSPRPSPQAGPEVGAARPHQAPASGPTAKPAPRPKAAGAAARRAPADAALERAAVDALIAGDFERAQRLYGQLAQSAPPGSVFHEALRILAQSPR